MQKNRSVVDDVDDDNAPPVVANDADGTLLTPSDAAMLLLKNTVGVHVKASIFFRFSFFFLLLIEFQHVHLNKKKKIGKQIRKKKKRTKEK